VTDFARIERDGWERTVDAYYEACRPVTHRLIGPLLDAVRVRAGNRVLDVGTGPGDVAAEAAGRGAEVIGIDLAAAMINLAVRLHPRLRFVIADAVSPPFEDGAFDVVVGNFTLHHIPDQPRALASWRRLLRRSGCLGLTVWDDPGSCRMLGLFGDAVAAAGVVSTGEPSGAPAMAASDQAYRELLASAGFDPVAVSTIGFTIRPVSVDALWTSVLAATVRTAATILRRTSAEQERIRIAFDRLSAEYMTAEGLVIPVSVKLIVGRAA
jgi:ubiquinone/menaquinone biosynthesis C-methylase UbiE